MSIIDELVTNRTQSDVDHWKALHDKGWTNMTPDEKSEWNTLSMKGAYNYTDLNRVVAAMDFLEEKLVGYGYETGYQPIEVGAVGGEDERPTMYDWIETDIPRQSQMAQYLANVAALRAALAVPPSTPAVPADMAGLTTQEANDIEQILLDINQLLNNMAAAWVYSGEIFSGEVF